MSAPRASCHAAAAAAGAPGETSGDIDAFAEALFGNPNVEPALCLARLEDVDDTKALFCFLSDLLGRGLGYWHEPRVRTDCDGGRVDLETLSMATLERVARRMRCAGVETRLAALGQGQGEAATVAAVRAGLPPGRSHGMRFRTRGGGSVVDAPSDLPLDDYRIVVVAGPDAAWQISFALAP
jgi:hypothetical protein